MEVGPDRIAEAECFRTSKPDGSVKLKLGNPDPIDTRSLVTFTTRQVRTGLQPVRPDLAKFYLFTTIFKKVFDNFMA